MPYERFVSNHVMLNAENVKVGHETVSLYSKSYLVSDINYTALTEDEQEVKLRQFSELLNSFDSTVSVQISLVNLPMSREESECLMLHARGDGHDHQRQEFNTVEETLPICAKMNVRSALLIGSTITDARMTAMTAVITNRRVCCPMTEPF